MTGELPAAVVISLDLELHWGVRDHTAAGSPYRANLLGVRQAVPRMLELFAEYEIAATWAVVGFLFARSRAELRAFSPALRPAYRDRRLDAYAEPVGEGEADDPLHYGASLVEAVRRSPRQELATHTFSHYYCLEPGQDRAAFQADLDAAVAIMGTWGLRPRSIVFPRNQHNPAYAGVLRAAGVEAYRGNQRGWMHRPGNGGDNTPLLRAGRLVDAYVPLTGPNGTSWHEVLEPSGLCNLPASFFLRPYSPALRALEGVRMRRIAGALRHAAARGRIVHLWWHPHNFGRDLDENLRALRGLLEVFAELRERQGMQSLSMAGAAALANAARGAEPHCPPEPPPVGSPIFAADTEP